MKIGILTFPKAINYGTALQAAALSKTLSDMGHDVYFIEHNCASIEKDNSVFDLRSAKNPKYALAHMLNLDIAVKRKKQFEVFQSNYMRFSDAPLNSYDVVITGSDQVWNYNLTGDDYATYFLDFEKKDTLKVSYAGSFGLSEIDENKKGRIAELLSDFDCLSVREQKAADIIEGLIGKKPFVAVDPTLLMTRDDWQKMASPVQDGDYIFVYTVFNDEKLWAFAEKLSRETGMPIKTISYSRLHKHDADTDYTAGPSQWLGYMMNAATVITNSFHGTAFSINFRKSFYFNVPDNGKAVGSRLFNLTERYGVADRNLSLSATSESVNRDDVYAALDEDRRKSFEFINGFLNK